MRRKHEHSCLFSLRRRIARTHTEELTTLTLCRSLLLVSIALLAAWLVSPYPVEVERLWELVANVPTRLCIPVRNRCLIPFLVFSSSSDLQPIPLLV